MKTRIFKVLLIALMMVPAVGAAEPAARVVCFGDSITKRGYPDLLGAKLGVEAVMAGVAGNSSSQGLRRMKKDVLDKEPDVVVVFFGTNDGRVDEPRVHVPVEQYEKNLNQMVDECEKIGAKVVVCTLPPVNEAAYFKRHETKEYDAAGGLSKLWSEYREAALKVAARRKLPLVDLNRELAKHPEWLSPDGVHPSAAGTRIIADLISREVAPLVDK